MSTITWLHLSDLHFLASQTYDSNIVLKALLRDISERIRDDDLRPDFIIVSGDIAFAGRPEEYVLAQQFFDELLKTTTLPKNCLFLVPGNHDVDRSAISTLAAGATAILNFRDAVNRFLENVSERQVVLHRFHNYQSFISEYLGKEHIAFDNVNYFYVKRTNVADLQVAILGLNSAWLAASDQDRNQMLLGERQVRSALDAAKDADLRLAVMHHPFDWLQDFDRDNVEPLLCEGCNFVLHGHMHQVGLLQACTPDNKTMIIAAGACYETRQYPNSYNFVRLDTNAGRGTVYLRMYSDRRGGFWAKDVVNYRNVDDGTYTFPMPDRLRLGQTDSQPKPAPILKSSLFTYGRPVWPSELLNREDELRTIFGRLHNCESTAIVGVPHIGKTSLLLKLADGETQLTYLGDDAQCLVVSSLDLHPISSDYTPVDFWAEVLTPLGERSGDAILTLHLKQASETDYGRRPLEDIFNYLGSRRQRLVLLLDEFERLLFHPNFQDPAFFALLRSLATRTQGLAYVTASRLSVAKMNERGRELLDTGSPFFNNVIEVRPHPFDEQTVCRLLAKAGDALSADDQRFVRRVAGHHPFLLQAMAAALVSVSDNDRHAHAAERFYEWTVSHFDDLWNILDNNTRAIAVILGLIELGERALGEKFAFGDVEQIDALGPELRKLAEQGLAKQIGESWQSEQKGSLIWRGERWTVGTQAFAWWVRDVVIAESRHVPAFDEWLANKRYSFLMTQEQWNQLVTSARNVPELMTSGIGTLASVLFEELVRKK
jgi:UDP-2,3-diacylglucosamine pyrophosphatase LpxH